MYEIIRLLKGCGLFGEGQKIYTYFYGYNGDLYTFCGNSDTF